MGSRAARITQPSWPASTRGRGRTRSITRALTLLGTLSLLGALASAAPGADDAEVIEERPVGLASGRFAAAPWQIGALGLVSLAISGAVWYRLRRRATRRASPGSRRS